MSNPEEATAKANKRKPRLRRILIKLVLALVIALVISLIVLSNIGGNNPSLREGLEQFLSQVTGGRAVIGELVYMGFVPDVRVDAKDIIIQESGDPTIALATADKIQFSQPTWHYVFGRDTFEILNIENVVLNSGYPLKSKTILKSLSLSDDNKITVDASVNEKPVTAFLEMMEIPRENKATLYRLPENSKGNLILNSIDIDASVVALKPGTVLENISIKNDNRILATGNLNFNVRKASPFLTGDFKIGDSDISLKIHVDHRGEDKKDYLKLEARSSSFAEGDLKTLQLLKKELSFLPFDLLLKSYEFEGDFEIERYKANDKIHSNIGGALILKDSQIQALPRCDTGLTEAPRCAE